MCSPCDGPLVSTPTGLNCAAFVTEGSRLGDGAVLQLPSGVEVHA